MTILHTHTLTISIDIDIHLRPKIRSLYTYPHINHCITLSSVYISLPPEPGITSSPPSLSQLSPGALLKQLARPSKVTATYTQELPSPFCQRRSSVVDQYAFNMTTASDGRSAPRWRRREPAWPGGKGARLTSGRTQVRLPCEPTWPGGKGARLISGRTQVRLPVSAHLSLYDKKKKERKIVIYGHFLVTLHSTINETFKWLTSLPSLMRTLFWW